MGTNDIFRERTKTIALSVIFLYKKIAVREELRILARQLIRSATSVAANYRAACRARSEAEYYSRISIIIEECDETLFWFELIIDTKFIDFDNLDELMHETEKILSFFRRQEKPRKKKGTCERSIFGHTCFTDPPTHQSCYDF